MIKLNIFIVFNDIIKLIFYVIIIYKYRILYKIYCISCRKNRFSFRIFIYFINILKIINTIIIFQIFISSFRFIKSIKSISIFNIIKEVSFSISSKTISKTIIMNTYKSICIKIITNSYRIIYIIYSYIYAYNKTISN